MRTCLLEFKNRILKLIIYLVYGHEVSYAVCRLNIEVWKNNYKLAKQSCYI